MATPLKSRQILIRGSILLVFILGGCSAAREDSRLTQDYVTSPDGFRWKVVTISDLSAHSRKVHLFYVGTYHSNHLIYLHDKVLATEYRFALSQEHYQPATEFTYQNVDSTSTGSTWPQLFPTGK